MEEIWKTIEDYPNYEVSNFGRIKSKERYINAGIKNQNKILKKEKVLKQQIDKKGYCFVRLYNLNDFKSIKVHRLVANAFIEKADNKNQINHKDGNKQNNFVENLEWCTGLENHKHAEKHGLIDLDKRRKNMSELGKKGYGNRKQKIKQYDLEGNFIKEFNSSREASKELNISETAICNCVKGNSKSAGGYIWMR